MLVSMTDATSRQPVEARLVPGILREAVSCRAQVCLRRGPAADGTIACGSMVGQDGDTLLIRVHGDQPSFVEHSGVDLSAVTTVHGLEYEFPTTWISGEACEPDIIRLASPVELFVLERRLIKRRLLRRRLSALLTPHDSAFTAPTDTEASFSAVILNVSPHGLACRVPTSRTTRLSVDGQLFVVFSLGAGNQTFEFTGRIVSITEGGTPEQMVLGIEFIDGGTSHAQEALSAALADGIGA